MGDASPHLPGVLSSYTRDVGCSPCLCSPGTNKCEKSDSRNEPMSFEIFFCLDCVLWLVTLWKFYNLYYNLPQGGHWDVCHHIRGALVFRESQDKTCWFVRFFFTFTWQQYSPAFLVFQGGLLATPHGHWRRSQQGMIPNIFLQRRYCNILSQSQRNKRFSGFNATVRSEWEWKNVFPGSLPDTHIWEVMAAGSSWTAAPAVRTWMGTETLPPEPSHSLRPQLI